MPRHHTVTEVDLENSAPAVVATSKRSGLIICAREDVRAKHGDIILLLCSFLSGLCDSGTFETWRCFVCMHTGSSFSPNWGHPTLKAFAGVFRGYYGIAGNTIFLGLAAAGLPALKPFGWLRSLIAILAFFAGCLIFSASRNYRPRSRGMLAMSS